MKVFSWILLQTLLFTNIFNSNRSQNVFLKQLLNCDPNVNYDIMFKVTFKTISNKQYIDGAVILKIPFDNNIRVNVSIEIFNGKKYMYLFSITGNKACEAFHKYMGEFFYTLERYAQLIPGMCPIPKGTHRWHNAPLNFEQFNTIAMFPFGDLRLITVTTVTSDKNKDMYSCTLLDVEHNL